MLNRFFSFLPIIPKKNIESDLASHLKELHASKVLIDMHQKYLKVFHSKFELNQNYNIEPLLMMTSSATFLLSQLVEWYAQSKLNKIISSCMYLEREYELSILHLLELSSTNRIEPAILEIIENYYRSKRVLQECDNQYESMEYYSDIVNNIALTISLSIFIKQLYHYLSTPSQSYQQQISYYEVLYQKIDDEILEIANKFEALSDDDKRSIQNSLKSKLSIENAIEQDAAQKFFLNYFCKCKRGYIVHPLQVIIVVKVGEKITTRSELYEAYLFFEYLKTQVNCQGPLRCPSGAPIAKYQFSSEVNKAHQNYWVALDMEIKKLSLNKQETLPIEPSDGDKLSIRL